MVGVGLRSFRNPLNTGPDPFLTYFNKNYYLTSTQSDAIRMWRSPSLGSLLSVDPITVWKDSDSSRNHAIWAPEFYRFDNRWYMYYTADDGTDDHHRIFVLESAHDDPTGPYHFKAKLTPPNHDKYSVDPTILHHDGRLYLVYSGDNEYDYRGINIAPMSNPYTISGDSVAINADGGCDEMRQGPEIIYRNGRSWLTYSTCHTAEADYQIWMMSLDARADPLNPKNWVQHHGAVFSRSNDRGVYGPGHHSFFKSPDGTQDWILFHAKTTKEWDYSDRTTRAQRISWNKDGSPNFGTPIPLGVTQDLPSGDPGSGNYWINDDGRSNGDGAVQYYGNWGSGTGCGLHCFWNDDHYTDQENFSATFTFVGTRIALLSVKDKGNGIAAMSIDGGPEQKVDYYGGTRRGEVLQYLSPRLPYGRHTLRVRVTGERNKDSTGTYISIDRAEVYVH